MNKQDAHVVKILNDLGIKEEVPLTPEQEDMLNRALDPEVEFAHAVEKLFKKK